MIPVPDFEVMWICRMCEHLAKAMDAGESCCGKQCSGPWNGDSFSSYKGLITQDMKERYCLFCGSDSDKKVELSDNGKSTSLGICKNCEKTFDKYMNRG